MRLCRYLDSNAPRIGRLEGDTIVPTRLDDMYAVMRGADLTPDGAPVSLGDVTLLAPLRPGKLLGVAKNYADHAAELNEAAPTEPSIFSKLVTAVTSPAGPVVRPDYTRELDYEGELAVVIGTTLRHASLPEARAGVFGYTIVNDVSARDLQRAEPQWTRAKGGDTFAPMGPWIVTAEEIPDPQALTVRTWVNGQLRQDGHTSRMITPVAELVAWCSASFTLEAGDVIATGTPAGVGHGFDPPRYLEPGDTVRIEVERIGAIVHEIR
jgi:2-keto-4-pentenoate hydratase/2-oxohepta-3-ene-1,7-dioic acid hydratase in catechol pathway